jgi:hypothetical protein
MADTKISAFPAAAALGGTEAIPMVQAAADVISSPAAIQTYLLGKTGTWTAQQTFVAPVLGTPASGVATNLTGTAAGLTAGIALALKSATTTVDVSAATAPTSGQVLTATAGTTATWQTPGGGSGTVTHTAGALTANALAIGNGAADLTVLGSLGTTTTVLHGNAAGAPTFGAVNLATDVTGVIPTSINAQTGTSYTVVAGDQGKWVTESNAAAVAVTQPQATGSFTTGWASVDLNLGAGLVTVTPTTSTINGAASIVLAKGQWMMKGSDGTNYQALLGGLTANALRSATTIVDTSAAAAPTNGQVLTATAGTTATWQTPSGGGSATPGLIIGCQPIWTSTTQLSIGSGQLYIESTNTIIAVAASTITPSSPSASTWYHGYVNNSGTFTVSTTAPVAFATACGFARSKTGDTTNRYVGSFLTDGSSHFYRFSCDQNGLWRWMGTDLGSAPFRCLAAGAATSSTAVDCSGAAPVTARMLYLALLNAATVRSFWIASGDQTVTSSVWDAETQPNAAVNEIYTSSPCSSTQGLVYLTAGASGSAYIDVRGFYLQR